MRWVWLPSELKQGSRRGRGSERGPREVLEVGDSTRLSSLKTWGNAYMGEWEDRGMRKVWNEGIGVWEYGKLT